MVITQGTTPTHEFELDFSSDICKEIRFVYSQNGDAVVIKDTEDIKKSGNYVETTLTQEDTFKFEPNVKITLVLRILTNSNMALVSEGQVFGCKGLADKEVLV